jgi:hypothetical protein
MLAKLRRPSANIKAGMRGPTSLAAQPVMADFVVMVVVELTLG